MKITLKSQSMNEETAKIILTNWLEQFAGEQLKPENIEAELKALVDECPFTARELEATAFLVKQKEENEYSKES
jgi:hypothetical protein